MFYNGRNKSRKAAACTSQNMKLRLKGDVLVYVATTYQLHVFDNTESIILINEFQSGEWQFVFMYFAFSALKD
jgi:hypothetical protein